MTLEGNSNMSKYSHLRVAFLVFLGAVVAIFSSCSNNSDAFLIQVAGPAQGTTYHISYLSAQPEHDYRVQIDSILYAIDQRMSLWQDNSLINRLNQGDSISADAHLAEVLRVAQQVAAESNGAFDITVGPLVNAWGFGAAGKMELDSAKIDSLLPYTGYEKLNFSGVKWQLPYGYKIDLNAIAQGYTVDVIAEFLRNRGIINYLVEVGGEVATSGRNIEGKIWSIGIDKPVENLNPEQRFQVILALDSAALATSGNYRKFWVDEKTGIKYAHTINAQSGYPAKSNLLSASIIASSCCTADAWATACMAAGLESAKSFILSNDSLEGYLVFSNRNGTLETWQSPGFEKYEK